MAKETEETQLFDLVFINPCIYNSVSRNQDGSTNGRDYNRGNYNWLLDITFALPNLKKNHFIEV